MDNPVIGIVAVFVLVMANAFFVAAEFSLVAVRRSRVAQLVGQGNSAARVLQRAVGHLDASLAATQLGVTISSIALGWIGEPALAQLFQPLFKDEGWAETGAHASAIGAAFLLITALHIVLGELVPKSLALQRSEKTALWVVRPLELFRRLLWPVIFLLNGLGNALLKLAGLHPGTAEEAHHSPEELRLLTVAAGKAGMLHEFQQQAAQRLFNFGARRIGDIMTPRPDVLWIDADSSAEEMLRDIRACPHDQVIVCRGTAHHVIGMLRRQDLLDQILDGKPPDPLSLVREPLYVRADMPVLEVFDQFKKRPLHLAVVVDERNELEGIATQTDLLEAIIGYSPARSGEAPDIVKQDEQTWVLDGRMPIAEAFEQLGIQEQPPQGRFHTLAGLALFQLRRVPVRGDSFIFGGWRFEISHMEGRRIDKLAAMRLPLPPEQVQDTAGMPYH